ncbi:EAL domain, c-di-GMP-specific phosphodiesterase class I (or its enzymatically inactive variant) [Salinibacillus kushneri]|uniref:EAL domain, c-di-GMP-specific phosphodiesterase class I (Or its enzymatically inactive variant) n=1 Tax=Salinibacillus kushneri TaxID=237682 RepID=A0A1I0ES11_9BACI|nr:EAL domain-containing protein [Salinibacillus kushneri]SET47358.1 EAL domain, c-di-GMP-specific phosphodiesterase class I (or its enzymatically inactive variant) [Salinibacillus kushneri]
MDNFERENFESILDQQLFFHHFQPIIDIQNQNQTIGYEGLLRSHYIQNPETLFNTAIQKNRLFELDTASIIKAIQSIEDVAEIMDSSVYVFLNVYPSTLLSQTFFSLLKEAFPDGIGSDIRMVLEINESELIHNVPLFKKTLSQLQSLGLYIALDDVGKGASTFERIIQLSPNFIKLDKHFASGLHQSPNKQNMIRFFLDYCSKHEIKLILEGIETHEELETAKTLGITLGQGYLLGKPNQLDCYL